jgi:hypothetical protein
MSAEIFKFPGKRLQQTANHPSRNPKSRGSGVNIRELCFRSRELILQSSEADLVRDVCRDSDKAEVKLKAIRRHLQSEREWAAAQIGQLTEADTKLTAAVVAAAHTTANATVIPHGPRKAETKNEGGFFVEFVGYLRQLFMQEFAKGKDVDQIFDEMEEAYQRADRAKARMKARRQKDHEAPAPIDTKA